MTDTLPTRHPIRFIATPTGDSHMIVVDHAHPEGRAFILDMLRGLRGAARPTARPLSTSHSVDLEIADYIKWRATR